MLEKNKNGLASDDFIYDFYVYIKINKNFKNHILVNYIALVR